jgi:hypothetical protein
VVQHAHGDQRLAGQARCHRKLRDEHVADAESQHPNARRAQQDADRDRGGVVVQQARHRDAEEGEDEKRCDPRRHADHGADVPRRSSAVVRRCLARDQTGSNEPIP